MHDRLLEVVRAIGGRETIAIAKALSCSRGFMQRWTCAYRDRGIEAVAARRRGCSKSKINGIRAERLKVQLETRTPSKGEVCVLRRRDVQRIAKRELRADVSLSTLYRALNRLGYACLAPRPRQ